MKTKIIHYCWFGKNKKPCIVHKCIESWKKHCPDFKIIEWNEENFDIGSCDYVKEAYTHKKWAFVSDYCRYNALYNFGGVYLDTDVEIIKYIGDLPDNFVGFENNNNVASGLIRAATKGDEICRKILQSYKNDHFIKPNGDIDLKTVCERETSILKEYGLKANGKFQVLGDIVIFPKDYFCPKDQETEKLIITENTYSIHHYASSWYDEKLNYIKYLKTFLCKILPLKVARNIAVLVGTLKYDGLSTTIVKLFAKLKKYYF